MTDAAQASGQPPTIGVLTVATNRYLDYWLTMAQSADTHLFPGHRIVMHVFTDRAEEARAMAATLERVHVDAIQIEPLGWPDATLLRYALFDEHRDRLSEDVLIHLDADMLLVDTVGPELQPEHWDGGIALVRHPGFRRPPWPLRVGLYARRPRLLAADAVSRVRRGGSGSWETDERSLACVPRAARRVYVCGGTWMGRQRELLAMIGELAFRTRTDLEAGVVAIWHDESHINWFASRTRTTILGSEYCFAPGYASVDDLKPRILAVDKGDDLTR